MTKPSFDFNEVKEKITKLKPEKPTKKMVMLCIVELLLFAFIITFDLCMKDYLVKFLSKQPGMNYTVIDGFLDLTYSENTGAGFGMFKNSTLTLTIVTAVVIACVILYLAVYHQDKELLRISLTMVAGGGIGNLVDRIQLGYVRDFFEFTFVDFAIFNIADAFVTVGSILLIIYLILMIFLDAKKMKNAEAEKAVEDVGASVDTVLFTINESDNTETDDMSGTPEQTDTDVVPDDAETTESSADSATDFDEGDGER